AALDAGSVHLEGEGELQLEGGRLTGQVEKGEDDAVQFRRRLEAHIRLTCGRCLESFQHVLREDLDLFFMPRGAEADETEEEQDVALSDRDMVVAFYDKGTID